MIRRILIANRGEIACRIIKTARLMGIKTIAIYSDADRDALHVELADQAYHVGPAQSSESYLNIDKIIAIAKQAQVDAIHPGYGFLSENSEFARACLDSNIKFIGSPISAIEAMGSKSKAKQIMERAKVPLIKGYHGDNQDKAFLLKQAVKIGFPIMLKAAAGGGGKGMRVIHTEKEFSDALVSAKREAKAHFNDDTMLIEKYSAKPRHIEIQVLADEHGDYIHLFERDCSIQRRHQKIIEEAPAPNLDDKLRQKIATAAIKAAKAINYQGAGTVEFLLDENNNFYFMEMNTRLQVEHPITEMITNLDLVELQIRIASGEKLPLQQNEITAHGHAFEVRLYAEDPDNNFLPSIGTINYLHWPKLSKEIRVDTGIMENNTVSTYYDPMLAKLIVWGDNRLSALIKLQLSLKELKVVGIKTNSSFLDTLINHKKFIEADFDTSFISKYQQELTMQKKSISDELIAIVSVFHTQQLKHPFANCLDPWSPWFKNDGWRLNLVSDLDLTFIYDSQKYNCKIQFHKKCFEVKLKTSIFKVSIIKHHEDEITVETNNKINHYTIIKNKLIYTIFDEGNQYNITLQDPIVLADEHQVDKASMLAPMPGTIIDISVKKGNIVSAGEKLITLEAMKMEHTIYAPSNGKIKQLLYNIGDIVDEGSELLIFEEYEQ